MAEAFLKVVLDNLGALIKEEIGIIMGVKKEMDKLSSTLTTIQAVLEDAELRQTESRPIRDWLRKVNALAYEIDDILDECNTHVSKLNHSGSKLSRYSLEKVLYRHKIGRRMKKVTERLDSVAAERAKFHLREFPVDRPREVGAASRETGSLLNNSDNIFGRERDRDKIVKMLVEDAREKQEIMTVLPVLGVGGLGKTTLAQLVYKDPRVVDCFDRRIWVCVSDNFEMKTLVKAMIESATGTGKASDLQHLDALQRRLWELLSQNRYLIVLDDVWNDHQEKWCELKDILSCGSIGSSIIVTTRQEKVADIMGTLPPHHLGGLSDEHCWMLLKQFAFRPEEEQKYPELERIGKQIVKKCAGVPLAAKALGGILRFKRSEKEWIYVRESDTWKLSAEESLIMPALRLSYHHLPLELRHCFAYFAAFPKDHLIEKEELIRLWMAHGYISAKGTLQVEDVGNDICNELILRSLFQHIPYVGISSSERYLIQMHDLVHDLALSVMENKVPGTQIEKNITRAPSTIRQVNLLERCVYFPKSFDQDIVMSSVMELRSVRVLDASRTTIKELPSAIFNLKHLRFLNMSRSKISTLPDSLCSLWNLQILNLDYCDYLVALPKNIRYLHNLQHLCLSDCLSLFEMPSKMRELTNLKTLSMFVVGLNRGNQLEELQCLNLGRRLEICHLERVKDHIDAKKANLAEKKDLRELSLSWERHNNSSKLEEDVDEKVFEALQPYPDLESLIIAGFIGRHLPLWMTDSALGKIIKIDMMNCINCRRLPKLGELPCLERLTLANVGVEYITEYEVGEGNPAKIQFLALEELSLRFLPNLKGLSKDQENIEAFPNLKTLWIQRCYSLTITPISSLQKLTDLSCSSSIPALLSEQYTLIRLSVEIEENVICFPIETLVKFPNLWSLTISGAQEISTPRGEGLQVLKKLRRLDLRDLKTMTCLPQGLLQHLTTLRSLYISWCPELVELPEEIKQLQNLVRINFNGLAKMARLPEALQHLPSLTVLSLSRLPELESLPDWLHQLTNLSLIDCAKLVSLPALPNLKELSVEKCPELERRCQRGSGEDWHKIAHIRRLQIG